VTRLNQKTTSRPDTGNRTFRSAQEARLQQLETLLAGGNTAARTIDLEVERAALLDTLDRRPDAQQAFVDILRRAPDNFDALNQFGALLTNMGAISAACRVYSEAIAHHPRNPAGHVNLANLLLRESKYAEARRHYETALQIEPEHPQAHQGLGAVLSDMGEHATARVHFQKGFSGHAISALPYRGSKPPVTLLQLISSGGGNIPTASLLDDRTFQTTVIIADYLDPAIPLPPHQLVFNAIGDADLCGPALEAAARLAQWTSAPLINAPSAVARTGRAANAERLRALPGVRTARTIAMARNTLTGPDAVAVVASNGLTFPLLLRSPGFHTGRNFVMVESAAELPTAAAGLPGDDLLVIEYLDARGNDGNARKYRVMIVDGKIYPLHLAISRQWKVHYFTADMTDRADHRAEEADFLGDMAAVLGHKAMTALELIRDALGLDYGGVDFGLSPAGDILLFEANATMVVMPPNPDELWAYRRTAITRILDAVVAMILERATRT
jgi:tetratricopeptide (TPR) repeat protein